MSTSGDINRFKRACFRHQFGALVVFGLTLLAMLVIWGVTAPFKDSILRIYLRIFDPSMAQMLVNITPVAPGIGVLIAGLCWMERKARSTAELNCPQCKKCLADMSRVVVASKHCPHCGSRVLSEVVDAGITATQQADSGP